MWVSAKSVDFVALSVWISAKLRDIFAGSMVKSRAATRTLALLQLKLCARFAYLSGQPTMPGQSKGMINEKAAGALKLAKCRRDAELTTSIGIHVIQLGA